MIDSVKNTCINLGERVKVKAKTITLMVTVLFRHPNYLLSLIKDHITYYVTLTYVMLGEVSHVRHITSRNLNLNVDMIPGLLGEGAVFI